MLETLYTVSSKWSETLKLESKRKHVYFESLTDAHLEDSFSDFITATFHTYCVCTVLTAVRLCVYVLSLNQLIYFDTVMS